MHYDRSAPCMPFLQQFRAVPNLLTLLRLFIIPFLVIAILDNRYHIAFALFVLAGFSDGFDGLLARMLSQRTTLGLYLDPIADKLLLSRSEEHTSELQSRQYLLCRLLPEKNKSTSELNSIRNTPAENSHNATHSRVP